MNSPTTHHSQALSRPGRRPRREGENEEPGQKPKKVNSEIRKQQNRIASRNYREKRKQKLHYLQHPAKDESSDQQYSELSLEQYREYARSVSAEYETAELSSSLYILPSNSDFGSLSSSSAAASDPILAATAASFSSHHLATSQAYPTFPQNWSSPVYSPPSPANVAWNVSPWMPGMGYSVGASPRPEAYDYNPFPAQSIFEQAHTPSHQPRELLYDTDLYGFGSSYASQSHTSGNPNHSFGHPSHAFRRSVFIGALESGIPLKIL
ncbi:hypothetical protein EJ02DRAFT_406194 [Clathrospora elynae]|uniref:BZIP domain-containing protein n=1 Tax=Clathrospora elynae TaxID=706981 RepID=A0A6A5SPP1_9PLEO|nr:hypothetical protein EJ02DRAFT_406194 [Clathrospora elynae]